MIQKTKLEEFRRDRSMFRRAHRIMPDGRHFGDVIHDAQEQKMFLPLQNRVKKYFLFRLGRGWDKSSGLAWFCIEEIFLAKKRISVVIFASDLEQAGIVIAEIKRLIESDQLLAMSGFKINKNEIMFAGSVIKVMASDSVSSFGLSPDICIIDELSSLNSDNHRNLFLSAYTAAAKKKDAVLILASNAAAAFSKILLEFSPKIYGSSEWFIQDESRPAPWLDAAVLAEQKRFLPPLVYARLFENLDCPTSGNFISLADLELCIVDELRPADRGKHDRIYFLGCDYGRKNDRTAIACVHMEDDLIVLDDVWHVKGTRDNPVSFSVVENQLLRFAARFNLGGGLADPYQLQNTMEKLRDRVPLSEFVFNQASWNQLAQVLYHHIHHAKLQLYRDNLIINEILQLMMIETPAGLKFDHQRGGYSDIATALSLAITACLRAGGGIDADTTFGPDHVNEATRMFLESELHSGRNSSRNEHRIGDIESFGDSENEGSGLLAELDGF